MKDYAKDMRHKTGMKSLFGRKNQKKDGTDGKVSRPPRRACSSTHPYAAWQLFIQVLW